MSNFDKFFDCLNVRSLDEWAKKKKPYLKPYRSSTDERLGVSHYAIVIIRMCGCIVVCDMPLLLQWLESEFLEYLKEWEDSVSSRTDIEHQDKQKLMLSRETLEGLRITGKCYFCS